MGGVDMTDAPEIKWIGKSGTGYTYWLYTIGTSFDAVPANYIFCKATPENKWRAIYIGQTGDLSDRFRGIMNLFSVSRTIFVTTTLPSGSRSKSMRS